MSDKQVNAITVYGNTLSYLQRNYRCAVGKNGIIAAEEKRESDGKTPAGTWKLRECWYRADRVEVPKAALPLRIITPEDCWCDDPAHTLYNRHFKILPHPNPLPSGEGSGGFAAAGEGFSFEHLWREDHRYDLIVPLGYNDNPVIPGMGSAIFLHVAAADYAPTEGCVALAKEDLLEVLEAVSAKTEIHISG